MSRRVMQKFNQPLPQVAADSRPKPLPIFDRSNEGFDHLSLHEIAVEEVQLVQPEIKARKLSSGE